MRSTIAPRMAANREIAFWTAILMRTGKRRSAEVIISRGVPGIAFLFCSSASVSRVSSRSGCALARPDPDGADPGVALAGSWR
jgi:hypothetical protein